MEAAISYSIPETSLRISRWASRLGGVIGISVAVLVWVGWALESDVLMRIRPGLATMKPLTAFCVFLLGTAILLYPIDLRAGPRRFWAKAAALLALVTSSLVTMEHVGLANLPIDELIFREALVRTGLPHPGRFSLATGTVILLLSSAILLRDLRTPTRFIPSELLAVVAMVCSCIGILGYMYGVQSLYAFASYSTMALHTAVVTFILGLSVLLMRPAEGWMSVLNSPLLGGVVARRLLPAAILVPPAAGLIRMLGEMFGFYEDDLGMAFFVMSEVLLFSIIVFLNAVTLNQSDAHVHETTDAYKMAHEQLRLSEERLRMAVAAGGIAIWHWDFATDEISASDRLYHLTGLAPGTPLRRGSTMSRIHPDDYHVLDSLADATIAAKTEFHMEYRIRQADEVYRWVSTKGRVFCDEQGQPTHMEGVMMDIDAQKRVTETLEEANAKLEQRVAERTAELTLAKERAEQADHSKSQFLTSMSHELRTPLNAIIGFTGTLIMGLPGPLTVEQRRQLEMVRGSARHQLSLINDLLDLAKIEAGRVQLTLEPVDLSAALREVYATLAPMAETKQLTFHLDVPETPAVAPSDHRSLKQILINLANNAIKFTDSGSVRLTLKELAGEWRFLVEDTGSGISAEEQAKLFQAFGRIEKTGAKRQEGTGLGLHLSRKLAELLGGEITLESTQGAGSTFILALPTQAGEGTV